MQLKIKQLIKDWNKDHPDDKLNQAKLAREAVKEGIFKNEHSAINMIQYNINGKSQSVDDQLLKFLRKRFDVTPNEIIL